jgi:RND family efflux transporter MFP subunit
MENVGLSVMSASNHRHLVLICSLGLSALLVGSFVGGFAVWRSLRERMRDPEFLQKQLELLGPQNPNRRAGAPALVRVGMAQRKNIRPQRPIVGRLVEVRKVTVASEVTGKIIAMPVEEGTPVIGGKTVLAQVDDIWGCLALKQCQAQVASTKAKLKYERLELGRSQALIGKKGVSQSELEAKQAAVDGLQASLAEAEATVEEESERIARSAILAPFDGTVIAKHAEVGGHLSPGSPIVDIVSRGQVDAQLMVPESVVNMISVGQALAIRVDPVSVEVRGQVVSVTPYGPAASRTFPVRVRLDDQGGRLKVGMSVTVLISTGPETEALVVSRDAVLVRPDGSTVWVAVLQGEGQAAEVQPVPVTISARMQEEYAVEPETDKGRALLTAGARVVIEGAERLMPGQQVRIVTADGGPAGVAGPRGALRQARPATPAKAAGSKATDRWGIFLPRRTGGRET